MSTPSPSSSSSPPPPSSANPTASPLAKKPCPWSHQETVHLIQAYMEKWYSLKRGQLKAGQWEEVAVTVTARCGYDDYSLSAKTGTQCRHKMEKLRRRYREEKRLVSTGRPSFWPYHRLMDSMERGPLPISARPLAPVNREDNHNHQRNYCNYSFNVGKNGPVRGGVKTGGNDDEADGEEEEEEGEEEEEEEEEREDYGFKSRSINYILRKPNVVNRIAGNDSSGEMLKKRKREEMVEVVVERGKKTGERVDRGSRLAKQIRSFAERMMRVEKKKMEMAKEAWQREMQMEDKRVEKILDFHNKIFDSITNAFGSQDELEKVEDKG